MQRHKDKMLAHDKNWHGMPPKGNLATHFAGCSLRSNGGKLPQVLIRLGWVAKDVAVARNRPRVALELLVTGRAGALDPAVVAGVSVERLQVIFVRKAAVPVLRCQRWLQALFGVQAVGRQGHERLAAWRNLQEKGFIGSFDWASCATRKAFWLTGTAPSSLDVTVAVNPSKPFKAVPDTILSECASKST